MEADNILLMEDIVYLAIGAMLGIIIGALLVYILLSMKQKTNTLLNYDSEGRIVSIIER